MTNTRIRTDQFSLIIHGQEWEGEAKEAFQGKEGAKVCVTQKMEEEKFDSLILPAMMRRSVPL